MKIKIVTLTVFSGLFLFNTTYSKSLFEGFVDIPLLDGKLDSYTVKIADINNDGLNDVVLTSQIFSEDKNYFHIFFQNSRGGLEEPSTIALEDNIYRPNTLEVGDVNNDGLEDIIVGNSKTIEIFYQKLGGIFKQPSTKITTNYSYAIKVGDFNNDGLLDICGISWNTGKVLVRYQDNSGALNTFELINVAIDNLKYLDVGDVNNDRLSDIIVSSSDGVDRHCLITIKQNPNHLYSLSNHCLEIGPDPITGLAIGDVNGDSLNDVVVSILKNSTSSYVLPLYQNHYNNLVSNTVYSTYPSPSNIRIYDVNEDNLEDVIVFHGGWERVGVYLQLNNNILGNEDLYTTSFIPGSHPQKVDIGDINNDQLPDVVIAKSDNGLTILYHKAPFIPSDKLSWLLLLLNSRD